ncbi:MAG: hypothetical protein R3Y28_03775 [Candidatus Gastranaerophilales bacterium]
MKINQNRQNQNYNKYPQKQNQNFTGAFEVISSGLRFLDTNQAWGANAVDLGSMVIPRSCVDTVNRGPEAGAETAFRESTGTANHSLIGVYGTGAGMGLAYLFNKQYGIRADKIFADNTTTDIMAKHYQQARSSSDDKATFIRKYTDELAESLHFFNTDAGTEDGLVKLSKETKEEFSKALSDKLINGESEVIDEPFQKYLHSLLTSDTGAEKKIVLKGFEQESELSAKTLISNMYNLSKTFMSEKVDKVFTETKDIDANSFIKGIKKLNVQRSVVGLGIAAGIGSSVQPINMYMSKKRTGSDGFVGVKGRKKDNSTEFKMLKAGAAATFALGILATITTNPKKFLSKIQFQGMTPTMNQLKLVYGTTIASRLLCARDKDELRESSVKDTLGFANLLILGALVTKGSARAMDKSLINVTEKGKKNAMSWLTNSTLKTRDEILFESLKKKGIETVKDGKAIPFKELIKSADKTTKSKLNKLNISQAIGYVYSGLVLGVALPKLNIWMTNKSEEKRQAKMKLENTNGQNTALNKSEELMLQAENLEFLSKFM